MQYARHPLTHWPPDWKLYTTRPHLPPCFFFFSLTLNKHKHIRQTNPPRRCMQKNNLLHRGRGVQGGREVQAVQAGRGYHLFQRGPGDPASGKREGKSKYKEFAITWVWESKRAGCKNHTSVHNLATWSGQLFVYDDESPLCLDSQNAQVPPPPAVISVHLCDEGCSLTQLEASWPTSGQRALMWHDNTATVWGTLTVAVSGKCGKAWNRQACSLYIVTISTNEFFFFKRIITGH